MLVEDLIILLNKTGQIQPGVRGTSDLIAAALRNAVIRGYLPAESKLPASRQIASSLGLSRSTIVSAYELLITEGILEARSGDGTYVAKSLAVVKKRPLATDTQTVVDRFSRRSRELIADHPHVEAGNHSLLFPGLTDLTNFPDRYWQTISNRYRRRHLGNPLSNVHLGGYRPLREAIANHLCVSRGFRCEANQVIVMNGLLSTARLLFHLLCDSGDEVMLEDPGYPVVMSAAMLTETKIRPLITDESGAVVPMHKGKIAYLTPSHQFPMGHNMPASRRLAWMQYAVDNDCWILEDDYDNEFPLTTEPIAAMKAMDTQDRVFYTGTFSKVLASYLRASFLVVPASLVEQFRIASRHLAFEVPLVLQATIADYVVEGHFYRHIRRMRKLYRERKLILVDVIKEEFSGFAEISGGDTGLHLVLEFDSTLDDRALVAAASKSKISCWPLSDFCVDSKHRGLVIGYGAGETAEIVGAVRQLGALCRQS